MQNVRNLIDNIFDTSSTMKEKQKKLINETQNRIETKYFEEFMNAHCTNFETLRKNIEEVPNREKQVFVEGRNNNNVIDIGYKVADFGLYGKGTDSSATNTVEKCFNESDAIKFLGTSYERCKVIKKNLNYSNRNQYNDYFDCGFDCEFATLYFWRRLKIN